MSSAFHTEMRGPSLIGLGKRPSFTPAHQVDFPTGMGPWGEIISLMRRRRLVLASSGIGHLQVYDGVVLFCPVVPVGEVAERSAHRALFALYRRTLRRIDRPREKRC